jgi:hypothetical protein
MNVKEKRRKIRPIFIKDFTVMMTKYYFTLIMPVRGNIHISKEKL